MFIFQVSKRMQFLKSMKENGYFFSTCLYLLKFLASSESYRCLWPARTYFYHDNSFWITWWIELNMSVSKIFLMVFRFTSTKFLSCMEDQDRAISFWKQINDNLEKGWGDNRTTTALLIFRWSNHKQKKGRKLIFPF